MTARRRFRATILPPLGTRFTTRTAALFDGLAIVLVDPGGAPVDMQTLVASIRGVFKSSPIEAHDVIFAYVEDVELRGDGDAVRFTFEPVGNSIGALNMTFRNLLKDVGVTEIADLFVLEGRRL